MIAPEKRHVSRLRSRLVNHLRRHARLLGRDQSGALLLTISGLLVLLDQVAAVAATRAEEIGAEVAFEVVFLP